MRDCFLQLFSRILRVTVLPLCFAFPAERPLIVRNPATVIGRAHITDFLRDDGYVG